VHPPDNTFRVAVSLDCGSSPAKTN
jgi:hypothetical protein